MSAHGECSRKAKQYPQWPSQAKLFSFLPSPYQRQHRNASIRDDEEQNKCTSSVFPYPLSVNTSLPPFFNFPHTGATIGSNSRGPYERHKDEDGDLRIKGKEEADLFGNDVADNKIEQAFQLGVRDCFFSLFIRQISVRWHTRHFRWTTLSALNSTMAGSIAITSEVLEERNCVHPPGAAPYD